MERCLCRPGTLTGLRVAGAASAFVRVSGRAGCWRSTAVSRAPAFFSRSARAWSNDRSRPMAIRAQSGRVGPSSMAVVSACSLAGGFASPVSLEEPWLSREQRLAHGHTGREGGQQGDAALAAQLDRGLSTRDHRHREQRRDQVEHRAARAQQQSDLLEHAGRRGGQHRAG